MTTDNIQQQTPQSLRSHSCLHLLRRWNNWWQLSEQVWGKTPLQSVLKRYCQSNYRGSGLRPCDVTQTGIWSARFEKGVKILVDLKKNTVDFYHYRVVVYTHCQHTFQFKQLVKVHAALYDPFKWFFSLYLWKIRLKKAHCIQAK